MIPVITLVIIILVSLLITKIAAVALTHTGISREVARFQARSAFTGVGFTTTESEMIVNHPVRRRIIRTLMLAGNVGIVTVIGSMVLTFIKIEGSGSPTWRMFALVGGLVVLLVLASSSWIDAHLSNLITHLLKRYTNIDVKDYAGLLHVAGEYKVVELYIKPGDWLADRMLQDINLEGEGVLILGITRSKGTYIGAPNGQTKILPGDTVVVYGRSSAFAEIDSRRKGVSGDLEHQEAVAEHAEVVDQERQSDPAEQHESHDVVE